MWSTVSMLCKLCIKKESHNIVNQWMNAFVLLLWWHFQQTPGSSRLHLETYFSLSFSRFLLSHHNNANLARNTLKAQKVKKHLVYTGFKFIATSSFSTLKMREIWSSIQTNMIYDHHTRQKLLSKNLHAHQDQEIFSQFNLANSRLVHA